MTITPLYYPAPFFSLAVSTDRVSVAFTEFLWQICKAVRKRDTRFIYLFIFVNGGFWYYDISPLGLMKLANMLYCYFPLQASQKHDVPSSKKGRRDPNIEKKNALQTSWTPTPKLS